MRKKRNITETIENDQQEFKKLKSDVNTLKDKTKMDKKQNHGLTKRNAGAESSKEVMHGLIISLDRDIVYPREKQLFGMFKDSKNILLGRNLFVTYGSEEEAQLKLKEHDGKCYEGKALKIRYEGRSVEAGKLKKGGGLQQNKDMSRLVVKVPMSTDHSIIKVSFSNAVRILRIRKRAKDFKHYLLFYNEKPQAEQDLTHSKTLEIDGTEIEATLVDASDKIPSFQEADKNLDANTHVKGKLKSASEEAASLENEGVGKRRKKRKLSKSSE